MLIFILVMLCQNAKIYIFFFEINMCLSLMYIAFLQYFASFVFCNPNIIYYTPLFRT